MKLTTGYVSNGGTVYGTLEEAAASDFSEVVLDIMNAARGEYHHLHGQDFQIGKLIVEALPGLKPLIAEYDRLIALDAAVNVPSLTSPVMPTLLRKFSTDEKEPPYGDLPF